MAQLTHSPSMGGLKSNGAKLFRLNEVVCAGFVVDVLGFAMIPLMCFIILDI